LSEGRDESSQSRPRPTSGLPQDGNGATLGSSTSRAAGGVLRRCGHFVLAPFLGFLWSVVRIFIQAPAGRQRFNVLAALNAVTHELVTVTNDSSITSHEVCQLLHKLADLHLSVPITLFLDTARYQRCALVLETAARLHIELCFLPAYSPYLIERLWKFVRKHCLYSHYYPDFGAFKAPISTCLAQTHSTHKSPLDSLLIPRFQLFSKPHFVPV